MKCPECKHRMTEEDVEFYCNCCGHILVKELYLEPDYNKTLGLQLQESWDMMYGDDE